AEEAETLRKALEAEREAVAEKFASLDKEARKHESQRQTEFQQTLARKVSEFESLSRELLSKIEDRAARARVERETERRSAELKRRTKRRAKEPRRSAQARAAHEPEMPPPLRGVRIVRDGKIMSEGRQAQTSLTSETVTQDSGRGLRAPGDEHAFSIGDRVR